MLQGINHESVDHLRACRRKARQPLLATAQASGFEILNGYSKGFRKLAYHPLVSREATVTKMNHQGSVRIPIDLLTQRAKPVPLEQA